MSAYDRKYWQFIDDDPGYLRWLGEHPAGLVVNSERVPSPAYLKLHRASCKFINSPNRSNWTTTGYIKTCSDDLEPLKEWAEQEVGGELDPCGACKPDFDAGKGGRSKVQSPPPVAKSTPPPVESPEVARTVHQGTGRQIPGRVSTGCPELDLVWERYAADILNRPHVLIPDTEEDLNWHAFLGHSIDMQGFRAAEFAGIDPMSRSAPHFVPLQDRDIGVSQLGEVWDLPAIQTHLLTRASGTSFDTTLQCLKAEGGSTGRSLAEALETFPFRKRHSVVRALLQNSHVLKPYGYSFRNWLGHQCRELGENRFPPPDFRRPVLHGRVTLEAALCWRLQQTFYQVGEAMAPYMLCDWQLWLWNSGETAVFANFKPDEYHTKFLARYGRASIPADPNGFADWWLSLDPDLPPRLANECIWLGMEHKVV